MNTVLMRNRPQVKMPQFRIPAHVSDYAAASRRAMLETRRRILKKLTDRINKENCFSA